MPTPAEPPSRPPSPDPTEAEVDFVIAEAGGDARLAIRNLLHDLTQRARGTEASVSRGYVRGRLLPFQSRRAQP